MLANSPGRRRTGGAPACSAGQCLAEEAEATGEWEFDGIVSLLRRAGENETLDTGLPTECPSDVTNCVYRCLSPGFSIESYAGLFTLYSNYEGGDEVAAHRARAVGAMLRRVLARAD